MQEDFLNESLVDRYRIVRLLGKGGMGKVYLANDLDLPRQVAIKTIRPELIEKPELRKRIERECRMHATVGLHPHIAGLYDKIEKNGRIFLIMEYVEGKTLSELLADRKSSQYASIQKNALTIIKQLLEALASIHQQEIIHRDIKPSNIIVSKQEEGKYIAKLMDFGIARLETEDSDFTTVTTTDSGGPGTPAYMAPERIDPETFGNIRPATDLYSVGIILFEMLSTGPPFSGTMTQVLTGHLSKTPDLEKLEPDTPYPVQKILEKILRKKPEERYQSAKECIAAIKKATGIKGNPINDDTLINIAYGNEQKTQPFTGKAKAANHTEPSVSKLKIGPDSYKPVGKQALLYVIIGTILMGVALLWNAQNSKQNIHTESSNVKQIAQETRKQEDRGEPDTEKDSEKQKETTLGNGSSAGEKTGGVSRSKVPKRRSAEGAVINR